MRVRLVYQLGYACTTIRAKSRQKNHQHTTPLQNSSTDCDEAPEIEVTNPAHPLFGSRFPLVSVSRPPQGTSHVFVLYQKEIILRIPCNDTNLGEARPVSSSRLTLHAIETVISIAKECEELCQIDLTGSGLDCQNNSRTRSKKN
jgi:hypothetical protein